MRHVLESWWLPLLVTYRTASRRRQSSGASLRKSARWVSVIRPNLLRRDLRHLDLGFDYSVLRLSDSFHNRGFQARVLPRARAVRAHDRGQRVAQALRRAT